MQHHYMNYELGFGVTSKFWDVIFGMNDLLFFFL